LLSRVANAIYWMSRYVERAENTARIIDVNLQLSLDRSQLSQQSWLSLISTTGDESHFEEHYGDASRQNVMRYLTLDRSYPDSIASCIAAARENARTIRDTITSEMWEQLNKLHLMIKNTDESAIHAEESMEFYAAVKNASILFGGITDATMSRGLGWEFGRLGRMIERADKTSRILDVKYFLILPSPKDIGSPVDVVQWSSLLRSAGALEMYRQRFGTISPSSVAEFLMLDTRFPRSLTFCMLQAEHALAEVEGYKSCETSQAYRLLGRLRSHLQFGEIGKIVAGGMHEYLDDVQARLNSIDDAIHDRFFRFTPAKPGNAGESAQ